MFGWSIKNLMHKIDSSYCIMPQKAIFNKNWNFMSKLVSIIMPSFNTIQYISEAIQSVLKQTYTTFELIIVDDGSSDGSVETIKSFNDKRIIFIALEVNHGPQYVRNLALSKAQGDYIAFLDSDDFWEKDKLDKQINFMESTKTPLSYTPYVIVRENARGGGIDQDCNSRTGIFFDHVILEILQLSTMQKF